MDETYRQREGGFKRRSWTRWGLALLLTFWAVTAVTGVWWDRNADKQLEELDDRFRERGEPVELAEMAHPDVPDEQNAATYYRRAWQNPLLSFGYVEDETKQTRLRRLNSMLVCLAELRAFRREHEAELQEILELAAEPLALMGKAAECEHANWGIDYTKGDMLQAGVPIVMLRRLGVLAAVAAVARHEQGRDDLAVKYIRDILEMRKASSAYPGLLGHLVTRGNDSVACVAIEQITPELTVGADEGAADEQQVRRLIERLTDNDEFTRGYLLGLTGERSQFAYMYGPHIRQKVAESDEHIPGPEHVHLGLFGTLSKYNLVPIVRKLLVTAEAVETRRMPVAEELYLREAPRVPGGARRIAYFLADISMPSQHIPLRTHFLGMTSRHQAATALAIRLYELDHGARPERLSELVPDYLDELPSDPFAEQGHLKYLPGAEQPLVYSVGDNGSDDGGSYALSEQGALQRWESEDFVFFLDGKVPQAPCTWKPPEDAGRFARDLEEGKETEVPAAH